MCLALFACGCFLECLCFICMDTVSIHTTVDGQNPVRLVIVKNTKHISRDSNSC